jgi:hypothetical protein
MNKTIVLALAAAATVSSAALAQTAGAQVFFSDKAVGVSVLDASGAKLTGANYAAELFYGAAGADPSSFVGLDATQSPFYAVAARAGQWNGGTLNKNFPSSVAQGTAISVQVRVWDSSMFTTWAAAAAEAANLVANPAGLANGTTFQQGTSSAFSFTPPTDAGLLTPGSANLTGLTGFGLSSYTVASPEPSVVALGALGLGALLWRRRK